jgi:thymidylate synthase (FAD)
MIEFGDITVKFITNRGITHELVRHRHCSFAQESTRYVKYDGKMEFIRPVWGSEKLLGIWNDDIDTDSYLRPNVCNAELTWFQACTNAERKYKTLLQLGWRAQQAREVLPNSLKTEIVVKANFREFSHILNLRCNPKSHPQMVALMKPLLIELHEKIPIVFDLPYKKYIKED